MRLSPGREADVEFMPALITVMANDERELWQVMLAPYYLLHTAYSYCLLPLPTAYCLLPTANSGRASTSCGCSRRPPRPTSSAASPSEVRCRVETTPGRAWVPARPNRLIGRGWPQLGAACDMTWRWEQPPNSQLAEG